MLIFKKMRTCVIVGEECYNYIATDISGVKKIEKLGHLVYTLITLPVSSSD